MLRSAPSIALALGSGLLAALACAPDDARKQGAEGVAEAFYELAEHECHCIAEMSGLGSQVEDACRDRIGDVEEFFPLSCIEGVVDRHPEARASYDCAAEITYDYVDCLVAEGCDEKDECDDAEDEEADCAPTCDTILQSEATQCPQPPKDVRDEIEACFPTS